MAATVELEPTFVRALRLLHSKAKDSAEQLRLLVEESIRASAPRDLKRSDSTTRSHPSSEKKPLKLGQEIGSLSLLVKKGTKEEDKRREAEKRTFDKIIQDVPDVAVVEPKKAKLEGFKASPAPSPPPGRLDAMLKDDDGNDSTDAGDFALEMGLLCIVCRNMGISSGNQLVECQECHNLYHQECHKPPITDQDVNDPRLAWYCAKCAKNIKKLATKNQKPTKAGPSVLTKEPAAVSKPVKVEPPQSPSATRLFKRAEIKPPTNNLGNNGNGSGSGNKPTGLAGLAASLSGRNNMGKSSHSNNGSKSNNGAKSTTQPTSGKPSTSLSSTSTSSKGSSSSGAKPSSSQGTSSPGSASSPSKISLPSAPSTSTKSSSAGSSNNGSSGSKSPAAVISADKRLQIMKKKAEKKMQEKRWK